MDFSRLSCARMRARDVKVPLRSYHCGNDPARGTRGRGLRISSLVAGDPAVQESNIAGALLRGHVSRRGGNFCFEVGELFVCHRSLPVGCPLEEIESLEFHAYHARPFHTFKECGVPRKSGRRCSAWAGSRCRCHRALRGSLPTPILHDNSRRHFGQCASAITADACGFRRGLQRFIDRGARHAFGIRSALGDPARMRLFDGKIPLGFQVLCEQLLDQR